MERSAKRQKYVTFDVYEKPKRFDTNLDGNFDVGAFIYKNLYDGKPARYKYQGCCDGEDSYHIVNNHYFRGAIIA